MDVLETVGSTGRRLSWVFVVALLLGAACAEEDRNQKPTAVITVVTETQAVGSKAVLSAAESSDPDGDPLVFHWSLDVPAGSQAALSDLHAEQVEFVPDTLGAYTIHLSVDDGEFRVTADSVTMQVTESGNNGGNNNGGNNNGGNNNGGNNNGGNNNGGNNNGGNNNGGNNNGGNSTGLVANAGPDQNGLVGVRVDLDGSASTSETDDFEDLTFFWRVSQKPATSGAVSINEALTPQAWFVPDAEGVYEVVLEVRDREHLSTDTVKISVTRPESSACLMISEYIHASSANEKAFGIYNCGNAPVKLKDYVYCLATNDSTECNSGYHVSLTRGDQEDDTQQLAAGAVLRVCASSIKEQYHDQCDLRVGSFLNNLTGDDRILIYEDTDHNKRLTGVDLLIDAFGQTGVQPPSEIWKGKTFRRCNFTLYDGIGPFNAADYYTVTNGADFTRFGQPPTEGC